MTTPRFTAGAAVALGTQTSCAQRKELNMIKPNRVALYARVSTKNNGQNPETQLVALRGYAASRGCEVVGEYVEVRISGSKDRRPELDRLMADARRRRFDAVLVARFDRSPVAQST
jgi:DNA invertase Pin-like site-specific DNA recombinase